MELAEYNITFVQIKGKNNILADAISRLKTLNIYKVPLDTTKTPAASNTQENIMEIHAPDLYTVSMTMLCTEKKQGIMCRKSALQLCHSNKM